MRKTLIVVPVSAAVLLACLLGRHPEFERYDYEQVGE